MGFIRDIVNKADNSEKVLAEVKENLNVLMSLAETKAQLFKEEIEKDLVQGKTVDNLTIPITKVVDRRIEYRAMTASGTSDTLTELAKSINSMISAGGNATSVVTGIASIANNALNTIMGTGEGQEQVVKLYTVVADYPAIVRFDFAFWLRAVKASSIKAHMEKTLACVAYKSAVDITQLAFNDFLTLYGPILRAGIGSDPKQKDKNFSPPQANPEIDEINLNLFQSNEGREIDCAASVNMDCKDPMKTVLESPTPKPLIIKKQ